MYNVYEMGYALSEDVEEDAEIIYVLSNYLVHLHDCIRSLG
jgi:hypothetical protein